MSIFAHMASADLGRGTENFIQVYVPNDLIAPSTVTEICLKPRLFNYQGTTKYGLTEEVKFVQHFFSDHGMIRCFILLDKLKKVKVLGEIFYVRKKY